jgi:hypothetical protein
MIRNFSFAAALLIALSSLAFAERDPPATALTRKPTNITVKATTPLPVHQGTGTGTDAFRQDRIARAASEWRLLKAFPLRVCVYTLTVRGLL